MKILTLVDSTDTLCVLLLHDTSPNSVVLHMFILHLSQLGSERTKLVSIHVIMLMIHIFTLVSLDYNPEVDVQEPF